MKSDRGLREVWSSVLRGIFLEFREQTVTIKRLKLVFLQIKTRIAFTTFVVTRKTNTVIFRELL